MTFGEAIQTCIARSTTFSGRARRAEFWWFYLFVMLGLMVTTILDVILFWPPLEEVMERMVTDTLGFYARLVPITAFWYFLTLLPLTAAGWRRFQDMGRPGWQYVALLVLIVGLSIWTLTVFGDQFGAIMQASLDPYATVSEEAIVEVWSATQWANVVSGIQTLVSIVLIIALASPGTRGPNRFGEAPLA